MDSIDIQDIYHDGTGLADLETVFLRQLKSKSKSSEQDKD